MIRHRGCSVKPYPSIYPHLSSYMLLLFFVVLSISFGNSNYAYFADMQRAPSEPSVSELSALKQETIQRSLERHRVGR